MKWPKLTSRQWYLIAFACFVIAIAALLTLLILR